VSDEYNYTSDSLYSILVVFIRNYKYSRSVINRMKMLNVSVFTPHWSLLILSFIFFFILAPSALGTPESKGEPDYSEKPADEADNDKSLPNSNERKAGNAIGIQGDQLIYCEGDLNSCHNVLTNIICSNVKYCIVGDITPFVMSNPL
jgi:hypothetical protein